MPIPNKLHDRSEITDERHFQSKKYPDPAKIFTIITSLKVQVITILTYVCSELGVVFANGGKGTAPFFVCYYLIVLAFFYLNILLVLPVSLKAYRRFYIPLLLMLTSLGVQTFSIIAIDIYFFPLSKSFADNMTTLVWINSTWKAFQNSLLAFIVWGALILIRILLKQKILENNYLYSRISPHLLFNCLNLIHSNIQAISDKGGQMIVRLSALGRTTMKELADDGKVDLNDEVDMIRNLIEINRLRFEQDIYIDLEIGEGVNNNNLRLPAQLIFSLTDNVFKYGVLDEPTVPAKISIKKNDKLLFVEIKNKKIQDPDFESHYIGIINVRRRLENTYGNKFKLNIEDTQDHFELNLSFPI